MLESDTRCWCEIDLTRLDHNLKEIQSFLHGKTKMMAIVKANAYGAGDIEVAKRCVEFGIDFFGVSCMDEAINLRKAGIKENILILGYTPPTHFHYLHEYDIIQTLVSYEYACKLDAYAQEKGVSIRAHVKADTGMQRIGIPCLKHNYAIADIISCYRLKYVQVEGMFSHFSVSDDIDDEDNEAFTKEQIRMFQQAQQDLKESGIHPGILHLQNSYGIVNYPELEYDYVRPGIILLGTGTLDSIRMRKEMDLKPIMQLKANVSLVKEVKAGSSVSYGRHFRPQTDCRVATLSIGYADGYPRFVSNKGSHVLIHGKRAEIVGNICMDQMLVDVSHIDDVKEGDIAVLFGEDQGVELKVDELSRLAQTINNETFCWIGARVPRIYKKSR